MTKKLTLKYMDPKQLNDNPKNWRLHPESQRKQLRNSLDTVGWAGCILYNKKTSNIIDGHLRKEEAIEKGEDVLVLVGEWSEEEEKYILATFDPITAMADIDTTILSELVEEVEISFPEVDMSFLSEQYDLDETAPEIIEDESIISEKNIKDIKILNLYAGIGGNRKLWGNLNITAIGHDKNIADIYHRFYPNDKIVIDDAHDYLEKHFMEYDFIWSSPPCPTHSRMRKHFVGKNLQSPFMKPKYPDMKLYEEILFLEGFHKGRYCVENVISWYDPLIEPQRLGRHYLWTNFVIPIIETNIEIGSIDRWQDFDYIKHAKKMGYDISNYEFPKKIDIGLILRNMIHPKTGKHILESAYPNEREN